VSVSLPGALDCSCGRKRVLEGGERVPEEIRSECISEGLQRGGLGRGGRERTDSIDQEGGREKGGEQGKDCTEDGEIHSQISVFRC